MMVLADRVLNRFTGYQPRLVRTDPRGHRTPQGPEWAAEHQPYHWPNNETGRAAYARYIFFKLIDMNLLPAHAAFLFIPHTAIETRWGNAVWNNAFGNIKEFGNTHPWVRQADGEPYRAFRTPEEGLTYAVDKIRKRWPRPFAMLLAGDPNWYGQLGREQYYERDPEVAQAEFTGTLPRVRRYLRGTA